MRQIKLRFNCSYHDVYFRKASEDLSEWEIQGQNGGIIVYKPTLKRTILRGVVLMDNDPNITQSNFLFTERTHGFEQNSFTRIHYRG